MKIQYGELILDAGERSIRPDIFCKVDGEPTPHLLARQCKECGDISFPPFRYCLKCNCKGETVEKVMSNEGVLASYTIARQVMPGFNPDYVLANVRMKDDPTLRPGRSVDGHQDRGCGDRHGTHDGSEDHQGVDEWRKGCVLLLPAQGSCEGHPWSRRADRMREAVPQVIFFRIAGRANGEATSPTSSAPEP